MNGTMKKGIKKKCVLMMAMACMASAKSWAQYDGPVIFPTTELYDSGAMNAYVRALAETASRRKENYEFFADKAFEAFHDRQWWDVVSYVGHALDTKYYDGELYYIRGYAYEELGMLNAAKKDYRKGVRYGSRYAAEALAELKEKMKRK
jgi:tetratricopeptide (TPR) repeat protein